MTSHKPISRRRGIILTLEGWQKLHNAKLECEFQNNSGSKYTIEELSGRVGITTVTLRKVLNREIGIDKQTLVRLFSAFNLQLNKSDYTKANSDLETQENFKPLKRVDLREAVDVSVFYGRATELDLLEKWILKEHCRVVALLGMGGIGKTFLATKLVHKIQQQFEYIIWRSLYNAPPLFELLANLIQFLCDAEVIPTELPNSVNGRISQLVNYLEKQRCLIILDNVETIMQSAALAGSYREGYEDYGQLIRRVGEAPHISNLLLTSREKPKDVASLEGIVMPVRSLRLSGLKAVEGKKIFEQGFSGLESELITVVDRYSGNPLALKIVATTIQDVFDGNLSEFIKQDMAVYGDIRELLQQQFKRLSNLEECVMYWLAINREPILVSELREDIASQILPQKLLEVLESLRRRSLIERSASLFTLQAVVMEYMTEKLVEQVCEEIKTEKFELFRCLALMKATTKDYVREAQIRQIIKPIIDGLFVILETKRNIENQFTKVLTKLQEESPLAREYSAGNIINLLCYLKTDLRGYNFSNLSIWQADLRRIKLHDANFTNANLAKSVFAETFGGVLSVAFSHDDKLLAIGNTDGEIRLYQVVDWKHILSCKGHTNWVVSLAFSSDNSTLASSSTDYSVKLWNLSTGKCLKTLKGHDNDVWSVVFSPDSDMVISGSDDHTIRLWDVHTGECLRVFQGHINWVLSVAFSPDGLTLLSGSDDHTIRLWDVHTGECLRIFKGHLDGVRSISLSPNGQTLVSSSDDCTVRLWDVSTGECLKILQGHSNRVFSVAFSSQADILASGSFDQTVKLWDVSTGECLRTFQGHSNWVFSIAFSSGNVLASGSYDQTVRLWDVSTGECLRTFQGYSNQVISVAFSPDGQTLVSGSDDYTVRLWDVSTGKILRTFQGHSNWVYAVVFSLQGNTLISCSGDKTVRLWDVKTGKTLRTFQGHSGEIWSVAFSPDSQTLVSGSDDHTVRLWDVSTGECLRIFQGHNDGVWSVAFNTQGTMIISGAWDQTIRLWDVKTGQVLRTFQGHTNWIWSVTFSPQGTILASGSLDHTVKLWSISTGECIKTLQGHTNWVRSVAFSWDGQMLASSSHDCTVRLWDVSSGQCIKTLQGHRNWVWSIAFSPDNQTLVSGSEDETIKLWDVRTGKCLKTLEAEKPYERMTITGITGLTDATIAMLKVLGAVD